VLRWGDKTEAFPDWSPIAYVPIDPAGNGEFFFPSRRAIPFGVTHIWAECVSYSYQQEIVSCTISEKFLPAERTDEGATRFSILTDLHLASKPWMIKRALRAAESDTIQTGTQAIPIWIKTSVCRKYSTIAEMLYFSPGIPMFRLM
jgi:hypothetical protein